ncbi:hypothetical protein B0H67DRAFT_129072 [Lasiosphaeris hirsuta]|uniref:Uncharacterized protein n=1 Tax=Lasiosphaeris hirsuta TaxID=260670 RepID=A0AA40B0B6_9PEZI|nr:hypothetical protein B0H67DRAFT_129072 [Lasiosphaeris hirsuta]
MPFIRYPYGNSTPCHQPIKTPNPGTEKSPTRQNVNSKYQHPIPPLFPPIVPIPTPIMAPASLAIKKPPRVLLPPLLRRRHNHRRDTPMPLAGMLPAPPDRRRAVIVVVVLPVGPDHADLGDPALGAAHLVGVLRRSQARHDPAAYQARAALDPAAAELGADATVDLVLQVRRGGAGARAGAWGATDDAPRLGGVRGRRVEVERVAAVLAELEVAELGPWVL